MSKKQKRSKSSRQRPLISEVMQARTAADGILRRALADRKFRDALRKNPSATLRRAGIPAFAVEDVSREMVVDGASLAGDCSETCWVTCLITCAITGTGRLPGRDVINPL